MSSKEDSNSFRLSRTGKRLKEKEIEQQIQENVIIVRETNPSGQGRETGGALLFRFPLCLKSQTPTSSRDIERIYSTGSRRAGPTAQTERHTAISSGNFLNP